MSYEADLPTLTTLPMSSSYFIIIETGLSPEEEIEKRSCLAAIEIEERRKEIEREEKEFKGKEGRLKQK
ncbi:unnamed protein product, partial [Porites evermanni]